MELPVSVKRGIRVNTVKNVMSQKDITVKVQPVNVIGKMFRKNVVMKVIVMAKQQRFILSMVNVFVRLAKTDIMEHIAN